MLKFNSVICCIFFLLLFRSTHAQKSIKVEVLDKEGFGIQGASVFLNNSFWAFTNDNGVFELVTGEFYNIEIFAMGFKKFSNEKWQVVNKIILEEKSIALDPILVVPNRIERYSTSETRKSKKVGFIILKKSLWINKIQGIGIEGKHLLQLSFYAKYKGDQKCPVNLSLYEYVKDTDLGELLFSEDVVMTKSGRYQTYTLNGEGQVLPKSGVLLVVNFSNCGEKTDSFTSEDYIRFGIANKAKPSLKAIAVFSRKDVDWNKDSKFPVIHAYFSVY